MILERLPIVDRAFFVNSGQISAGDKLHFRISFTSVLL